MTQTNPLILSGDSVSPTISVDKTKAQGSVPKRALRDVVVCIPAYNEQGSIAAVIIGAKNVAGTVLVCDDGSRDMTAEIARRLGARVLVHGKNLGKGKALATLMEEAQKLNPEVVVTIDADGQHNSGEIPAIVAPVFSGDADVVIGVRQTKNGGMPKGRVIGNKVLDEATSRKAGVRMQDTQSGLRAYSNLALSTLDFVESGMSIESQTLIDAAKAGLRIVGVPVSTTYNDINSKRNALAHFSVVLDYLLSRTIVDSPLLYLGLPGLVTVLLGVLAGLWVVNTFFLTNQLAIGTGLISAILIMTGAIALATAIILKFLIAVLER